MSRGTKRIKSGRWSSCGSTRAPLHAPCPCWPLDDAISPSDAPVALGDPREGPHRPPHVVVFRFLPMGAPRVAVRSRWAQTDPPPPRAFARRLSIKLSIVEVDEVLSWCSTVEQFTELLLGLETSSHRGPTAATS